MCAALGLVTEATIADHVTPHRGDYDLFWHGELQSLCKPCHDGPKKHLEVSGHLRGCDVNGRPLDPTHHWTHQNGAAPPGGGRKVGSI